MRASVVLPEPDSPTMPSDWPACRRRGRRRRARRAEVRPFDAAHRRTHGAGTDAHLRGAHDRPHGTRWRPGAAPRRAGPVCTGADGARSTSSVASRTSTTRPSHEHEHLGRAVGDTPMSWRDEQHAEARAAAQVVDRGPAPRLTEHVERGGGLVGDQDLRRARDRDGDHDPLVQAAGELVRERVQALARAWDADALEQIRRRRAPSVRCSRGSASRSWADREPRVERDGRVLEDDAERVAQPFSAGGRLEACQMRMFRRQVRPRRGAGRDSHRRDVLPEPRPPRRRPGCGPRRG